MGLFNFILRFHRDEKGSALPLIALVLVVICGFTALAMDLSYAYRLKSQLQTMSEAAALAAATGLPDESEAKTRAIQYSDANATNNLFKSAVSASDVEFGKWDDTTNTFVPSTKDRLTVKVTADLTGVTTFFASVFGAKTMDISADAVATAIPGGPVCIAALDPNGSQALELNSNATINVQGCEIYVNSTSSSALYTDSNAAVIDADRVCVRGNTKKKSNSSINPSPDNGCTGPSDPYASRSAPSYGGCDYNGMSIDSKTKTLQPGVYCDGLEIKGNANITFAPGEYIIKGKKFFVDSNSSIQGTDVGFYLTGKDAVVEFNSNSQIDLSAPTSGDMKGMIFFQDRAYGGQHKWDSNNVSNLNGAIYFPSGELEMNSNTEINTPSTCTQIIAYRILFDSNSGLDMGADFSKCPGGHPGGTAGGSVVLRQ